MTAVLRVAHEHPPVPASYNRVTGHGNGERLGPRGYSAVGNRHATAHGVRTGIKVIPCEIDEQSAFHIRNGLWITRIPPVDFICQRPACGIFGDGGDEGYRTIVEQVRAMATRVGTAVRAEQAPVIDGRLDDAAWQRADVLTDFTRWGQATPAQHLTRARLVHDGRDLYIALECAQDTSALVTKAAPRDGATWHDDSVEIFMNPRAGEYEYVQLIINAAGAFFDQWRRTEEMEYNEALKHNFDADWAATVEEGMWTAEIRVPLHEFGFEARPGALLPMNLVRNVQGDDGGISSWFPSIRAHADAISRGWIVLE